jgi:hypothetical protein
MHPYFLSVILDIPYPLTSTEMNHLFKTIDDAGTDDLPDGNNFLPSFELADKNPFHEIYFLPVSDKSTIEEILEKRIPMSFIV